MLVIDLHGFDISVSCKYSKDYVYRLRQVPGAHFEKALKVWVVPFNSLPAFEKLFKGEIVWKTPEWQIKSLPVPDVRSMYKIDENIRVPDFKLAPYDYQEFGIKFMIDRLNTKGFVFNTDDVGIGKTVQAMGGMMHGIDNLGVDRVLIMCKKSIKLQWKKEILKFTDIDTKLLVEYIPEGATKAQRNKIYNRCTAAGRFVLITTYQSTLSDEKDFDSMNFDMLVVDEAHILRNRTGKTNLSIKRFADKIRYKMFLTGTPLMTKPVDIYGLMQIADEKYLGKWADFEKRHITYEWRGRFIDEIGYKHLDELRDLVQDVIIRRTEKEVSLSLPKIIPKQIDVPMDKVQTKITDEVAAKKEKLQLDLATYLADFEEAQSDFEKNKLKGHMRKIKSDLAAMMACDQAVADDPRLFLITSSQYIKDNFSSLIPKDYKGSPKTEAIIEQLEDIIDKGEKAILFTKYVRYIDILSADIAARLKINVLKYHGQMNGQAREDALQKFTGDQCYDYPVIVMSEAGSEGINAQVANHQFNCDQPDSPAIKTQRMGRIRRASSTFAHGYTYDFITEGSFDETKLKTLERASNLFNGIVEIDDAQSVALRKILSEG